jgi:hypothetical protein
MAWASYYPVGIAYRVLAGPFSGSQFFLYYLPRGRRTGVTVVGDFVSPTIPSDEIPAAVDRFFSVEFDQDRHAIEVGSTRPRVASRARPQTRGRAVSSQRRRSAR